MVIIEIKNPKYAESDRKIKLTLYAMAKRAFGLTTKQTDEKLKEYSRTNGISLKQAWNEIEEIAIDYLIDKANRKSFEVDYLIGY